MRRILIITIWVFLFTFSVSANILSEKYKDNLEKVNQVLEYRYDKYCTEITQRCLDDKVYLEEFEKKISVMSNNKKYSENYIEYLYQVNIVVREYIERVEDIF